MHPPLGSGSLPGLVLGLCMSLLTISNMLPVTDAALVAIPIDPYWREYLGQEADTIAAMGEEIDKFQIRRLFACPLAGTTDTRMLPAGYNRSLTYLLRVLVIAWQNLGTAISYMQSPNPNIARAVLRHFGVQNVGQAELHHRLLTDFVKNLVDLRSQIATVFSDIDRIHGLTFPSGNRPHVNLQNLALQIEAGRPVNGDIVLETTARTGFTFMFKFAYDKAGQLADEAGHAAAVTREIMGDAYTSLVIDPDPFGFLQEDPELLQIDEEDRLTEAPLTGPQSQSERFEEEDQAIGPWQTDGEDLQMNTEENGGPEPTEENDEEDSEEGRDRDVDWSIPRIFERIKSLANCWDEPLWEVYDLALNVLGPIPDLSSPEWISRSP
ncbi:hypothetical protein ABW21_db0204114 [Orbilia brochopaga]|nr:hypothetical protein ABW21_db0204114 [Drechslerella brochopaga]